MEGDMYELIKESWQGEIGDVFIMTLDDSSDCPFFKREDGEQIMMFKEPHEEASIHLNVLKRINDGSF